METKKSYNFLTIKLSILREIVSVRPVSNPKKFDDWLGFSYVLTEDEAKYFATLIERHQLLLGFYNEEDLKMKFISPILNQVNFLTDTYHDWYEANFSGFLNGIEFSGFTDYMVAKGIDEPEKPYFFIQEFKPSIPDRNPENQLLAELLIAIEKNKTTVMRGSYIIGRNWFFMIVEKIGENQFEYFVSQAFDALKIAELKQIYIALQAVKHKYCVD